MPGKLKYGAGWRGGGVGGKYGKNFLPQGVKCLKSRAKWFTIIGKAVDLWRGYIFLQVLSIKNMVCTICGVFLQRENIYLD